LGELLRASVARQGKLVNELQALLPKLATCDTKISLANLPTRATRLQAAEGIMSLASRNALSSHAEKDSLAGNGLGKTCQLEYLQKHLVGGWMCKNWRPKLSGYLVFFLSILAVTHSHATT